jgi:hypothetical protein
LRHQNEVQNRIHPLAALLRPVDLQDYPWDHSCIEQQATSENKLPILERNHKIPEVGQLLGEQHSKQILQFQDLVL